MIDTPDDLATLRMQRAKQFAELVALRMEVRRLTFQWAECMLAQRPNLTHYEAREKIAAGRSAEARAALGGEL